MEIKMIQSIRSNIGPIRKGEVLKVRYYPDGSLFKFNTPYQVVEGQHSGVVIPLTHCIQLEEDKTFTEKEMKLMENLLLGKYERERKEKERAQNLVGELTKQIKKKNDEIERLDFYLSALTIALKTSCDAIQRMKELEKAK